MLNRSEIGWKSFAQWDQKIARPIQNGVAPSETKPVEARIEEARELADAGCNVVISAKGSTLAVVSSKSHERFFNNWRRKTHAQRSPTRLFEHKKD